jgi:hypothetical protein
MQHFTVKLTKLTYFCPTLQCEFETVFDRSNLDVETTTCECCGTSVSVKYMVDCKCHKQHSVNLLGY